MEYRYVSLSNEPFSIELPPATGTESYFISAPAKAGSVLLFNVVHELASVAGRSVIDVLDQAFSQGVVSRDLPLEALSLFERPGHIFTGLRDARFLFWIRAYRKHRKILLVRDPRDMAVSLYYSVRHSHPAPQSGLAADQLNRTRAVASTLSIEEFLNERWADGLFETMRLFATHVRCFPNFRVFRYEDIIFDKEAFVAALAAELQIKVPNSTVVDIANRHDVWPTAERPNEHIRQVSPGNYKAHLSIVACKRLELLFGDVFEAFGYPKSCAKSCC